MKNSLIFKILIYLTLIITLVFSVVSFYIHQKDREIIAEIQEFNLQASFFNIQTIQESQLQRTTDNMNYLAKNIAKSSAVFLANYAKKDLKQYISIYMQQDEIKAILVEDSDLEDNFLIAYKKANKSIIFDVVLPSRYLNYKNITTPINYKNDRKIEQIGKLVLFYDENIILDKIQSIKEKSFEKVKLFNEEVDKRIHEESDIQFYFLLGFFTLLLVLISLLIIYYVIKPLKKINYGLFSFFRYLNNEVTQIEKINLKRSDEFGQMAKYLNKNIETSAKLHSKIFELNSTLEQRVQKKTEELRVLNESLEQRVKEEVRKNMQKDNLLYQQSKLAAMGEMIGNIAHQWRQPLNALGLILQSFNFFHKQNKLTDKIVIDQTTKAKQLISKMSSTIDDFRNFFDPNKEKVKFNVDKSINNVISLVNATYEHNKIEIYRQLNCDVIISSYQGEFEQVLLNFLQNAKDALVTKDIKKAIKIRTLHKNGIVRIKIFDNGGGIEKKLMDRIFEPYFTTKNDGTGIGLYMSKQIIQEHMGGKLYVKNRTFLKDKIEYKGACFCIELDINKV